MGEDANGGGAAGTGGLPLPTAATHPTPQPWLADSGAYRVAPTLVVGELDAVDGYPRLAVQLLHNRGSVGMEAVRALVEGDWAADGAALSDTDIALARLARARDENETTAVWGDFDCDGMTSCALVVEALRNIGMDVRPYVAQREDDGRGLNAPGVEALAREGVRLIVTTDCGTSNVAEIALAARLGMDVIVTDHHPLHGEIASPLALVNPRRDGDDAAAADMAGVGVAFRLARSLLHQTLGAEACGMVEALLDLVAIGTVADVVPLTPYNWRLVRAGLRRLNASPRPGVRALLRNAGLPLGEVSARDIAFAVAPRLNACGRLGEPSLAVELLLCQDESRATALAERVEALHQQRQGMTEALYDRVRQLALASGGSIESGHLPTVLVAVDDDLPLGLIGLVAGRLSDELGRAVFVVSRDDAECRGSGRAPAGYNLGGLLARRADLFKRFGGHAQAAGFTITTDRLHEVLAYLDAADASASSGEISGDAQLDPDVDRRLPAAASARRPLTVDCILPLGRLVPQNVRAIRDLEPYGAGFTEPVFVAPRVQLVAAWRSGPGGKTLRLRLREGGIERTAVWPKQGRLHDDLIAALPSRPTVDLLYSVGLGRQSSAPLIRVLALLPPGHLA